MEEINIRQASIADLDGLCVIGRQTFLETFAEHNAPENIDAYLTKALAGEQVEKELTEVNSQWFLALVNHEIAGYLKVNFGNAQTELQNEAAMEIERIYVLQKFQGKNIGKLLLTKAITIAHDHHVDYVWLGVWEQNFKAQAFYKKHGFITFDQHSFFMGDDEQTDWLMKLPLKDSTT